MDLRGLERSILPQTEEDLFKSLLKGKIQAQKMQKAITLQIEKARAFQVERSLSQFDGARAKSTSTSGSSSVFICIPTDHNLVVPPTVLKFAAQTAGTHTIPNPRSRSCCCGSELSTVHVLSCKQIRGVFVRHDLMRDVLKKICAMAGVVASIEVMVVEGRQKRMDLVLHFSNPVRRVWVDVSVFFFPAHCLMPNDANSFAFLVLPYGARFIFFAHLVPAIFILRPGSDRHNNNLTQKENISALRAY